MIPAVHAWPTNGDLIADAARLGYLPGSVLDATYGRGKFWTKWRPGKLWTNDLNPSITASSHYDFRQFPETWDRYWDAVVFDPPYKLSGTPALGDFDDRYGIGVPSRWQDRMGLIVDGAVECARVSNGWLLVKCQDQVVSGRVRWQTREVSDAVEAVGFDLVDRFDLLGGGRPQPVGRRQVHAHGRPSSLLVFRRAR